MQTTARGCLHCKSSLALAVSDLRRSAYSSSVQISQPWQWSLSPAQLHFLCASSSVIAPHSMHGGALRSRPVPLQSRHQSSPQPSIVCQTPSGSRIVPQQAEQGRGPNAGFSAVGGGECWSESIVIRRVGHVDRLAGSERRLAFSAFMRSLLPSLSAFVIVLGFPLPAAPRMDAALIFFPQWGHFIACQPPPMQCL